jgi:hypothetical protein
MTPINNSRMGRVIPDVEPAQSPLVDQLLASIARFGDHAVDVGAFQAETRKILGRAAAGPRKLMGAAQ